VRQNAGGNVSVLVRLLETLALVADRTRAPARRLLLREQVGLVWKHADRTVHAPHDRSRLTALLAVAHDATAPLGARWVARREAGAASAAPTRPAPAARRQSSVASPAAAGGRARHRGRAPRAPDGLDSLHAALVIARQRVRFGRTSPHTGHGLCCAREPLQRGSML
jgi:hypothetical protein